MIVYRDASRAIDPGAELAALAGRMALAPAPTHDEAIEFLIEFGEIEAALADAIFPERDGIDPQARLLRGAALEFGRLAQATWRGASAGERAERLRSALRALDAARAMPLPGTAERRTAEGYAWYALYPETYLAAAERLGEEVGDEVVCVGIRSIGTSLSAVVAAGMQRAGRAVELMTLRPRGHPFDRRPILAPGLRAHLAGRRDAWFLLVDEGPGLSGSSFAGTAEALSELGVPDGRIVIFPSWLPDEGRFVSEAARRRWPLHAKAHAGFEEVWLAGGRLGHGLDDIGGGLWRRSVALPHPPPAVQYQHERRKYLAQEGGRPLLLRFAGLGRYGRDRLARAERLAAAGLGQAPRGLRGGFLALDWIEGRPLSAREASPGLLRHALRHVAHLASTERTGRQVRTGELRAMMETNVREGLGLDWLDRLGPVLDQHLPRLDGVEAVAVDGRMLPHEWLETASGFAKTDALDHHDDHFFPGTQDAAWDLAGLAVEFRLPPGTIADLAEALAATLGDPGLPDRLAIQETGYAAWRLGYADLAAGALGGTEDGARFAALARRYGRLLRRSILRLARGQDRRSRPIRATGVSGVSGPRGSPA
jgi:hypothetical protein